MKVPLLMPLASSTDPMTLEEARYLLEELQAKAPAKVLGRRPNQEERTALKEHKNKVAQLLESFPSSIRWKLETESFGCSSKKKGRANKQNERPKKKNGPNLLWQVPITTNTASLPTEPPCDYSQAIAKPIHFLAILDFEATCNNVKPAPYPQEIIEFPTILLNVETGQVESVFHTYIKPDVHPTLTPFCTELTGIRQEKVDHGISLANALGLHQAWLEENHVVSVGCPNSRFTHQTANNNVDTADDDNDDKYKNFAYVTCGDWDLATCLPKQMKHWQGCPTPPAGFAYWINIKKPFYDLYGIKKVGMAGMLRELGLQLQGRHHSGIDDCRNIVRICQQMLQDGWKPKITSS